MRVQKHLLLALGAAAMATACGGTEEPQTCPTGSQAEVTIDQIVLSQGVAIALVAQGQPTQQRNAPVIAGRGGQVRVFAHGGHGWTTKRMIGELTVHRPGQADIQLRSEAHVGRNTGSYNALSSTFNFQLPPAALTSNAQISFSIRAANSCAITVQNPATLAPLALQPQDPGRLRVVLIPVNNQGRLPQLTSTQINRYRQAIYEQYPLRDLQLSVHNRPLVWNKEIRPNQMSDWSGLLNAVWKRRAEDRPSKDTVYSAVFQPPVGLRQYCAPTCIGGLAGVPMNAHSPGLQASVTSLFPGDPGSVRALVHEVGHTMGRLHAPCGVDQYDPNYPYSNARLHSWGYSAHNGAWLNPNTHHDFMSYCTPAWVSDYTYRALFNRISALHAPAPVLMHSIGAPMRPALQLKAGALSWASLPAESQPMGADTALRFLDGDGDLMGEAQGVRVVLSHDDEGLGVLYLPTVPAGATQVEVEGFGTLALPSEA